MSKTSSISSRLRDALPLVPVRRAPPPASPTDSTGLSTVVTLRADSPEPPVFRLMLAVLIPPLPLAVPTFDVIIERSFRAASPTDAVSGRLSATVSSTSLSASAARSSVNGSSAACACSRATAWRSISGSGSGSGATSGSGGGGSSATCSGSGSITGSTASGSGSGSGLGGGGGGGFCSSSSFAIRAGISSTTFGSFSGVGIHGQMTPRKNIAPRMIVSKRRNFLSCPELLVQGRSNSL